MPELSTNAVRLLSALRSHDCYSPRKALPDHKLAEHCRLPQRAIIGAAGELLDAGILCLASCHAPAGRYLLRPTDDLEPARAYLASLRRRALSIFRRYSALKRAVERCEIQRAGLFPEPRNPKREPSRAGLFARATR